MKNHMLKELVAAENGKGEYGVGLSFYSILDPDIQPMMTLELSQGMRAHDVADRLISAGKQLRQAIREGE